MIGVLAIAALLISAVVVSVRAFDAQGHVAAAVCRIAEAFGGDGGCDAPSPDVRGPEDYLPPEQCVVTADGGSVGVRAGVVLFGGANGDWLIEELGDGTYRMTRGAGLEGGASVGIGFDVSVTGDGHRYGAGLGAGASASAHLTGGEVHHVATLEDAEALLAAKNVATAKDVVVGPAGPSRWVVDQLHDAFGDTSQERVVPDETYYAAGAGGEASGVLNAFLGGASAQASIDQTLGTRIRKDGSWTVYFKSAAGISGDLQGLSPGDAPGQTGQYAELSGRLEGEYVLEVEYDKAGVPTSMTVRSSYVADGTAEAGHASRAQFEDPDVVNEVAMNLPIRTDADREVAMRTLYSAGIPYAPGLSDGFDVAEYASPGSSRGSRSRSSVVPRSATASSGDRRRRARPPSTA
ncbi:hypothetical protein [Cellulomonas xiejunii]|uniref:Uncharacterized protein n=1 Tax=Cellulomonas xiejunii TaxID=2968083 RepID=A0ABY5KJQ1_9CELL|nr:hypothetical protein [Cellulomonas xiejunii]MCC2320410.1 hypothetical protein [Cellulomonas xiejunii]UUI70707.1 hypothetical protein NP048_12995 [Cellulomonas xiejunii]